MGIGKTLGWILVVLGCIEVLVGSYFSNSLYLNFTFMIAGYFLIKQNNKARKIISSICGVIVSINILLLIIFTIFGLPEDPSFSYFGVEIEITGLMHLYLLVGGVSIFFSLIIIILNSKAVAVEFANKNTPV